MEAVTLPPDVARFADEAVAQGRFANFAHVVQAGVSLLRRLKSQRAALLASVVEAEADGEQNGFLSLDEAMRAADRLIDEMARPGVLPRLLY